MTSKEALEKLQDIDNFYEHIFEEMGCYKAIEQDLERLEYFETYSSDLEKELDLAEKLLCNSLYNEGKLKKALNIIKDYVFIDFEDIYLRMVEGELTQQEYELLKEVLGNEQ